MGDNTAVGEGASESRLAELSDGRILLESRGTAAPPGMNWPDTEHGRLYSISNDGENTFSRPVFRNNLPFIPSDAGLIAVPVQGYPLALLISSPNNLTQRENMTVAVSFDDARSWACKKTVYAGPAFYSDLALLKDCSIGLLYGKDRVSPAFPDCVALARFNFAWLYSG